MYPVLIGVGVPVFRTYSTAGEPARGLFLPGVPSIAMTVHTRISAS